MASLDAQAERLEGALADLVKKYQFRGRDETVAYGLTVSQAYALRALHESGPLPAGELAAALRLSVSAGTRLGDQLVARGLVARVRSDADRRVCEVRLTTKGRALWRRIQGELVAADREVLRAIRPAERETVIRVIGQLSRAVDAWRAARAGEG